MKRIVFDLDGTICQIKEKDQTYLDVLPIKEVIEKIRELKSKNWYIIISTARHMVTCGGNVDLVKNRIGNQTIDWLLKYNIPYDEIQFGKPYGEYYVDDKALNLKDFINKEF